VSARARGGLGIVPARTQQHGYLWRRAINPKQLEERLAQAHRPYHAAIEAQLCLLLDRFGCALLLDCHSMPPPPQGIPPIVFGDCNGRAADPWLGAEAIAICRRSGFDAGLNDPFAGGHIIDRHARPGDGLHALQIEIDRRCYLDQRLAKPAADFEQVAKLIETLAVELGRELLGRQYATAAE
jgi:N-formylglutamate amidohydrolase